MEREMMEWMKPFQQTFNQDFFRSFHHLFEKQEENFSPKINLYEGNNELFCLIFLPGLTDIDHVLLNVYGQTLEISGNYSLGYEIYKNIQTEVSEGEFKRTIELPYPVREDKVDAKYKYGVLEVHLYKLLNNLHKPQRIPIENVVD